MDLLKVGNRWKETISIIYIHIFVMRINTLIDLVISVCPNEQRLDFSNYNIIARLS